MKIVINISEDVYVRLFDNGVLPDDKDYLTMENAIRKGVVLPKGHGDLIDRSKIYKAIHAEEDNLTGAGMTEEEMDAYNDGIDVMYAIIQLKKAIIEADKEDQNEE